MSGINPNRIVRIEGQELAKDISADIVSVSFEDHATDTDMATLVVNNQNGKWVDADLFEKGKTIEILLGYGHDLELVFKGTIVRPELSFPEDGVPVMTVRAYDLSFRMRRKDEKKNATFENITDSQLARKLAGNYSFGGSRLVIDETKENIPYIARGNRSDWDFLKERAVRIGFELYVEIDAFHFHKPKDAVQKIPGVFEYRRNLKSFEPRLTTLGQVSKIVVKGWDPRKKQPIVAVATSDSVVERAVLGDQAGTDFVKQDFGDNVKVLHDLQPASVKEAEELAKAYFRQKEYELIDAAGTCIGEPTLKAKSLISIEGVGRKFSGTYYLTRVAHTFDESGYLCDFECKRNAVTAAEGQGGKSDEALTGAGYGMEK